MKGLDNFELWLVDIMKHRCEMEEGRPNRRSRTRSSRTCPSAKRLESSTHYNCDYRLEAEDAQGLLKVACTTWKRVISVLEGRFSDPEHIPMDMYKFHVQNWTYLSHYPAASVAYRLQHYYKFMFVRDPLARVVSAFRDKFERRMEAFSLKEAWTILETYRQGPLSLQNVSRPNITFQEFVQYVVDTPHSSMNQHWRSYLGLCQPCAIHYDFVGHLDTLEDDAKTVLSAIGADDKVAFPARSAFYSHASSEAAVNHYLSQLSPDLFQKLVSKYETDYSIFGYKLPER
ncbi:CHST14 [Branchiostoma lanceolatum]|uniref:Carbohydrate sulfotransferase n=1 Tax=Branchiostoma lanceolatum TaxID=7740 RepID=A0A8K0A4H5_BRALA|nr:CHST14 [Branchiostoma lanceolatum]